MIRWKLPPFIAANIETKVKVTGLSQSKISYHIKILKDSGLITDRQEGRWVYYKLDLEILSDIQNWMGNLIKSSTNERNCK